MKSRVLIGALGFSLTALAGEQLVKTLNSEKVVSAERAQSILKKLKKSSVIQGRQLNKIATYDGGLEQTKESSVSAIESNCFMDEQEFFQAKKSVIDPWIQSFKNQDASTITNYLTSDKKNWPVKLGVVSESYDRISLYPWKKSKKFDSLKNYFSQFKIIEHVELNVLKYNSDISQRDSKRDMKVMMITAQLDIRGIAIDGSRRHDRGPVFFELLSRDNSWKMGPFDLVAMETALSPMASFAERTVASQLDKIPQYQRLEAIRRGGYALATSDVNKDGFPDMYVGAMGAGQLLLGSKDGKYTATAYGLAEETYVKTAIFADFDNDGFEDLLLVRFVPTDSDQKRNDIVLYKNLAGKSFVKEDSIKDQSLTDYAMPATVADFNGDGLLDFYVGFPGAKDFTTFGRVTKDPKLKSQGLYFNKGSMKFNPQFLAEQDVSNFTQKSHLQKLFPHSSLAADFDQDGDMDILVIDDRDQLSPAYQNDGKGRFTQVNSHIGLYSQGYGMGAAVGDIDNDGILDILYSNVNFNNKFRITQSCDANWGHEIFGANDHGLKLYKGIKKGQYADATGHLGLQYAGEGLSGLEYIDYNNDGHLDIYVTNGLWSGTDVTQDLSHLWMISSVSEDNRVFMESHSQTQSEIMNILSGFKGDLETGKPGKAAPHLAGHQRNRLFRNKGDGTFIEVGYLEGVDSIADGYVVAKIDLDNDGDQDLVLRNGDPGTTEVHFPAVQVFVNATGGNHLRLNLLAGEYNRAAIGAWVKVVAGKKSYTQHLMGNNGTVQSERIMHFGLGKAHKADKVEISWPSGKKTVLRNLASGTHTIKETSGQAFAKN